MQKLVDTSAWQIDANLLLFGLLFVTVAFVALDLWWQSWIQAPRHREIIRRWKP
ncbi:MAG: hypothetical protein PHY05_13325 [Methanothrix sp.]|nr:hypothetical protein [Methanothrix sp.]